MAKWATTPGLMSKVNFLMVCIEWGPSGLRTAQDFGRRFQLPPSVINGYIDQKTELPGYGQLGCQGFIVLGPDGEFALQRTVPCYLDAGAKAFQVVEKVLATSWNVRAHGEPAVVPQEAVGSAVSFIPPSTGKGGIHEETQGYAKLSALIVGSFAVRGALSRQTRFDDALRRFGEVLHRQFVLSGDRQGACQDLVARRPVRWSLYRQAGSGRFWRIRSLRASLQWIVRKVRP